MLNPEKIWHKNLTELSILTVRCRHFTLENKKNHFQQHYSYNLLIIYVVSHENNVTTLTCEMQNFSFHPNEGLLRSFECWWLWEELVVGWHRWLWKEPVVMCSNWSVRQAPSQQVFKASTFCMDTCFQSFLPLIGRLVHYAVLKFSPIEAAATSLNRSVSIHALRSSCSVSQTHYFGYTDNAKH